MPIVSGATPAAAQETSRANGASPSSAALSGCVTMHTDAPSFWPLALPAVTVASGSLRPMIGRSAARRSSVVSARGCSSRSTTRSPLRSLTVTGTISSANVPSSCAATARWCERSASSSWSARDMPYSRRTFSAVSIMPPSTTWSQPAGIHPRAREPVGELDAAALDAPADAHRVELGLAHAVDSAGQDELGGAGLDLHAAEHDRLQPRAAAAVELQAGHLDAEARVERGDAADRRRLAVRIALAEDHVVDLARRQRGARDELGDHRRGERGRRHVAEHAAEASHGRAQWFADHGLTHRDAQGFTNALGAGLWSDRGPRHWAPRSLSTRMTCGLPRELLGIAGPLL